MPHNVVVDLADCSRFRQTVAARPPRVVHATAMLLLGLLAAAIAWAALVQANLVVRAAGRVRSVEVPTRIFAPAFTELAGRVVEAPYKEGDLVQAGDTLVRLDTAQIDNRLEMLQRSLEAAEEELSMLAGVERLLDEELAAAQEKAQAELAQAQATLLRAQEQRLSAMRSAAAGEHAARDVAQRMQKLKVSGAVTEEQIVKAETALREAEEKLVAASLPADLGPVQVAQRALELVEREFAVRRAEAQARRVAKEGEVAAVHKDVRQLRLQQEEAVLRSPIDGVVVSGHVDPGDVLEPGKPVMEIAPRRGYRFEAALASEDVGQVRVGMPVRIRFDAYDYMKYGVLEGQVAYISPDSRSIEQSRSAGDAPVTNAVAYVVRVELQAKEVGRGELRGAVKLGLGGTAEIVTARESLLSVFLKRIRHAISLA